MAGPVTAAGAVAPAPRSDRAAIREEALRRATITRRQFWTNVRGDYRRHGSKLLTRTFLALLVFRFGGWAATQPTPIRIPTRKIYGWIEKFTRWATGVHMYADMLVGEDLHLIHAEAPISFHPDVVIGDRVGIMHNVTIGATVEVDGVPIIGNDVYIGTGAVVVGPVTIGDGARIAANSLVMTDIPANCTAIGVPARPLPRMHQTKR